MSRASALCVDRVVLKLDLVASKVPKGRDYNGECNRTEGQMRHKGLDDRKLPRTSFQLRLWHKADVLNALTNVRFWEQSGH